MTEGYYWKMLMKYPSVYLSISYIYQSHQCIISMYHIYLSNTSINHIYLSHLSIISIYHIYHNYLSIYHIYLSYLCNYHNYLSHHITSICHIYVLCLSIQIIISYVSFISKYAVIINVATWTCSHVQATWILDLSKISVRYI